MSSKVLTFQIKIVSLKYDKQQNVKHLNFKIMATIVINGRLTGDIKKGDKCYFFTVAESKRRDPKQANFYRCIANLSDKQAEHLQKGTAVFVSGDLDIDKTVKNGITYTNTNVLVMNFRFNGTKRPAEVHNTETTQNVEEVEINETDDLPF